MIWYNQNAISVFKEHKNSPPRSSGGYFIEFNKCKLSVVASTTRPHSARKNKFVKKWPYTIKKARIDGLFIFAYFNLSQSN